MGERKKAAGGTAETGKRTGTDRLTDSEVRNAKPAETRYKLTDGAGMYLLVEPNGGRYWRMKYRHGGKERLYAIGKYPETTLAQARQERAKAREWLARGLDPTIERRADRGRAAAAQANTFREIANEWYASQAVKWSAQHKSAQRSRLDREILPVIGDIPIRDVTASKVLEMLNAIAARGAHEVAAKCRIIVSQTFRHAIMTDRASDDPANVLRGALARPAPQHRATIPAAEMPALFKQLTAVPAEQNTKLALFWVVLTACRTGEMRFATWSEIEGDVWRVPPERMKMRLGHVVPLSKQCMAILKKARALRTSDEPGALIFPGFTRYGALSENALLALLARAGYFGRQTAHGFRASFSTWAHEVAEADPDVVEACLAHVSNDVRSIYNRATYLSKRRKLLQQWADRCEAWGMKI